MLREKPPYRADHVGSLLRPPQVMKARDDFAVPMEDLMAFLGLSRSATYERLVAARRTQVSVP